MSLEKKDVEVNAHRTNVLRDVKSHIANSQALTASAHQFGTLIERMMPSSISETPEGKLVTAIFKQAWNDAACHTSARRFFTDLDGGMVKWCKLTGLNAEQIKSVYLKNHRVNQEDAQ